MDFLNLPVVMIENILSYLSYDEIAKNRLVSKSFNEICSRMLNRGFLMIERRHALASKSVKALLPRRESERKYHPLARHCDILNSIETRLSMLNMTYSKFIDHGLCCFIPGKVIDEMNRVLHLLETAKTLPRAHETLQELRDISSMAIEHFDDKISPAFRKKMNEVHTQPAPRHAATVFAPLAMKQELQHLRRSATANTKLMLYLAQQFKRFHKRMFEYKKVAIRQRKVIRDLTRKQRDQDWTIADLRRRIEECDVKYNEITHTNQAVGGKVITASSPAEVASSSARHFSSQIKLDLSVMPIGTSKRNSNKLLPNIKPRQPQIRLPSLSEDTPADSPAPSTSAQSAKSKLVTTMAKIRDLTNEIRHLNYLSKGISKQKLKRPLNSEAGPSNECKKKKLD